MDGEQAKTPSAYADGPSTALQALMRLFPATVNGKRDFSITLRTLEATRLETLAGELQLGLRKLSEPILSTEEFISRTLAVIAATRTERDQTKIRLFARLLTNGVIPGCELPSDEFDELLDVIRSLSPRQFQFLLLLERFECLNEPQRAATNSAQFTALYWPDLLTAAEEEVGIPRDQVTSYLARLNRSGCYNSIIGSYLGYNGDRGLLTPLWFRLRAFISTQSE